MINKAKGSEAAGCKTGFGFRIRGAIKRSGDGGSRGTWSWSKESKGKYQVGEPGEPSFREAGPSAPLAGQRRKPYSTQLPSPPQSSTKQPASSSSAAADRPPSCVHTPSPAPPTHTTSPTSQISGGPVHQRRNENPPPNNPPTATPINATSPLPRIGTPSHPATEPAESKKRPFWSLSAKTYVAKKRHI
ncbi:hypothetical protein BT69DRAFT_1319584 [Atractiella rhizophila]|nr:hypothetical protein BT69DRAFT_1319584 [Atractiella rhizophila]